MVKYFERPKKDKWKVVMHLTSTEVVALKHVVSNLELETSQDRWHIPNSSAIVPVIGGVSFNSLEQVLT